MASPTLCLVLAQEVQSSIQLVRESCGLLSSHFRAKSPHLGLGEVEVLENYLSERELIQWVARISTSIEGLRE